MKYFRHDIEFGADGEVYVYYWDTRVDDGPISVWLVPGTWQED